MNPLAVAAHRPNKRVRDVKTYTSFGAVGTLAGAKSSPSLEKSSCLLERRLRSTGRTGWGELIVIIREIVMLARTALALTT